MWADNAAARGCYARLDGREVEDYAAATEGGGTAPQVRVRWERAADLATAL